MAPFILIFSFTFFSRVIPGIYLPFFWEHSFCWKWPIALGYTRGHFSALVPMEPDCDPLSRIASAAQLDADDLNSRSVYLPLITYQGDMLPIHFLSESQVFSYLRIINKCDFNLGKLIKSFFKILIRLERKK